jgi:ketosteroid isomerase-like protein
MKIKGMYFLRRCLVPLLAALAPWLAHAGAVEDVLAADTAFAARAGEVGQGIAFAEYLAPDGILFRPEPVSGQAWLAGNEAVTGRLEWWPSAAAVDCSGRLAVSTGPWRYTNPAGGEPATGHYLSIWRLDDDGQWQLVLDHGIAHGPGAVPAEPLQPALAKLWGEAERCRGRDETDRLTRAEQDLNQRVQRDGLPTALHGAAAKSALGYRDDEVPGPLTQVTGDEAFGRGSAAAAERSITLPGSDMAVTFGVLKTADAAQRALYLRVWQRDRRNWRVAIDLRTPLPATPEP